MSRSYPVTMTAELDPQLRRGLWLVKWLLAVPHYLILLGLWLAFAVLSIVAFFAIAFTGRYPRTIFDFNVGVMRWTWRVTYYAYGALGTDRYPPFTLADVADYPTHLEVAYPEHLSRGLVLIKWWLLALQHYLVVAIFAGGGLYALGQTSNDSSPLLLGGGLVGLLVFVAAVVLLFTGNYPRAIFDLVIGLQRWAIRVAAYAALMTDEYPPFRLDQGGSTDSLVVDDPKPIADPTPAARTSRGSGAAIAAGIVMLVVFGSLLVGAGALMTAKHAMPDEDGFFMTQGWNVDESTYAITSEPINVRASMMGGFVPSAALGTGKLTVESSDGSPMFIGVARTSDVRDYLRGVAASTVTSMTMIGNRAIPMYRRTSGGAPSSMPDGTDIWTTQSESGERQSLTWPMKSGNWTVVVMRADGAPGITADIQAGATFPAVSWIVTGLFFGSGISMLMGMAFLIGGLSTRNATADKKFREVEALR